ncbi:uncharacterized protein BO72DRAFT_460418 [Aspergillus fijiensis CBS 313.89]|uniref:Uncharacterized protein n=1 Tax=Aspergillus fijiensis CBS 313.89 TaxID=1448319 RepID=A0A8G1RLE2_9EURO|nr:uncharacterized protein BO72DRAFT_460418 [Aspergillus fijiensis CBS 313.89]RAK75425.1 hypothetical protein BO72DRAFT_460418 [Aspergillus fijiensis CBS 313.89]
MQLSRLVLPFLLLILVAVALPLNDTEVSLLSLNGTKFTSLPTEDIDEIEGTVAKVTQGVCLPFFRWLICKPKTNKSDVKEFHVNVDDAKAQAKAVGFTMGKSLSADHFLEVKILISFMQFNLDIRLYVCAKRRTLPLPQQTKQILQDTIQGQGLSNADHCTTQPRPSGFPAVGALISAASGLLSTHPQPGTHRGHVPPALSLRAAAAAEPSTHPGRRCPTCGIEGGQAPIPSAPTGPGAPRFFITSPYHYDRTPAGLYVCTYISTARDGTSRSCNLHFSAWPNYRAHHHQAHERAADAGHSCEGCAVSSSSGGASTANATATAAATATATATATTTVTATVTATAMATPPPVPVPVPVPAPAPAPAPTPTPTPPMTLTDLLLAVEAESTEPPMHLLPPPISLETGREVSTTPTTPTTPKDQPHPQAAYNSHFKRTKEGHFICTFPVPTRTRTTTAATKPCGWRLGKWHSFRKHYWRQHMPQENTGGCSCSVTNSNRNPSSGSTHANAGMGGFAITAEANPVPGQLQRRRSSTVSALPASCVPAASSSGTDRRRDRRRSRRSSDNASHGSARSAL